LLSSRIVPAKNKVCQGWKIFLSQVALLYMSYSFACLGHYKIWSCVGTNVGESTEVLIINFSSNWLEETLCPCNHCSGTLVWWAINSTLLSHHVHFF
jgi:hypothetical protein